MKKWIAPRLRKQHTAKNGAGHVLCILCDPTSGKSNVDWTKVVFSLLIIAFSLVGEDFNGIPFPSGETIGSKVPKEIDILFPVVILLYRFLRPFLFFCFESTGEKEITSPLVE